MPSASPVVTIINCTLVETITTAGATLLNASAADIASDVLAVNDCGTVLTICFVLILLLI